MFRKLLNVGKGHSSDSKLSQQQQQQQQQLEQQKSLFQLNEIRSYGFSHLSCLGYSASLSLLAVGSRHGLVRVLGNPSVEFSCQLEAAGAVRQIEFIDCRTPAEQQQSGPAASKKRPAGQGDEPARLASPPAKLVVLTDNGQLHLFELRTVKRQNFADNTTQTGAGECCQPQQQRPQQQQQQQQDSSQLSEYTKLEHVASLDYFKFKPDDEDRSRRVTTLEISADALSVYVGTEGGNLYLVPLDKFVALNEEPKSAAENEPPETKLSTGGNVNNANESTENATSKTNGLRQDDDDDDDDDLETTAVNLNDEPQIVEATNADAQDGAEEPFEMVKFDEHVASQLGDDIKAKKQGAIESIKRHPASNNKILLSYHRGLNVILLLQSKQVDKYFYHNQVLESSCFAPGSSGDHFYTSHNDGSYIKWDARQGSQSKASDESISQLYGPYPCKPTPKIQACTGLVNDQLEELVVFSGGMPRATYDDKNPVTIVRTEADAKDTIKTVLDFTSKVLDFVVITRPRGSNANKSTSSSGKKGKHKQNQQQQQQQRNNQIAVALAILAEEEFVVIDLLNSESYLEFNLPYLNCVHSSAITCNQHYSDISDDLYEQLLAYNGQQLKGKLSTNEWPITGGKVIAAPEVKSHDILLTGHEDGSVDIWDVSDLSMRHLMHLSTARYFSTNEDEDLVPIDETNQQETANNNDTNDRKQADGAWPPLKRVGRFDPYSDDTRLAIRRLSLCPQTGTLVAAGTGGQVLVFELRAEPRELAALQADEVTIVSDQRFAWKGRERLPARAGAHKQEPGFQLAAYVQLAPPVAATSLDLRSDWGLFALGTSYGFLLYDYAAGRALLARCTLNLQDFAIVSGDLTGPMSRKKSFRKSLRESFRRLRRGRSQRTAPQPVTGASLLLGPAGEQPAAGKPLGGRLSTGVRSLAGAPGAPPGEPAANAAPAANPRAVYSAERQVEQKVELSSIVRCIALTSAIITNNASFKPTLWVGTNSGQVLVYAITLASEQEQPAQPAAASSEPASSPTSGSAEAPSSEEQQQSEKPKASARLAKEIQLKHRAPIIAIFTSPEAPQLQQQQPPPPPPTADSSKQSTPERQAGELLTPAADQSSPESTPERKPADQQPARAPTPAEGSPAKGSSPAKAAGVQPRVLICSEEQFKVFNLPNLKPFCKFKLTAHEGLRAKKITITHFLKPQPAAGQRSAGGGPLQSSKSLQSFATQTSPPASPVPLEEPAKENNNNSLSALNNNDNHAKQTGSKELLNAKFGASTNKQPAPASSSGEPAATEPADGASFEPYMVCMSNQGDCAIYSVPELKRQAQIQVCKQGDVNGITSTMLTNYGEGYYLRSSSNFLRFSISSQRVLRVLSVV